MKINELFEDVTKVDFKNKRALGDDGLPKGAVKVSMMQAFGSPELAALDEAGVKLTEKPSSWEAFEEGEYAAERNIHQVKLKRIEKILGKLPTYTAKEIFGSDMKPRGPLANATFPAERMFIVAFNDDTRYLVDTTGANTYIRFWQKIV